MIKKRHNSPSSPFYNILKDLFFFVCMQKGKTAQSTNFVALTLTQACSYVSRRTWEDNEVWLAGLPNT